MGALAETQHARTGKRYTCRVGEIYSIVDDDDRAAMDAKFRSNESHERVAAWLTANGPLSCSQNTVRKHRLNDCQCRNG